MGNFTPSYFGLPLGHYPKSFSFWNFIIEKIQKPTFPLERAFLSKRSKLTLIQFFVSGIPTYFHSSFGIPIPIARFCRSLMRLFLGGCWQGRRPLSLLLGVCKKPRKTKNQSKPIQTDWFGSVFLEKRFPQFKILKNCNIRFDSRFWFFQNQ